jgi:hypothetical protein
VLDVLFVSDDRRLHDVSSPSEFGLYGGVVVDQARTLLGRIACVPCHRVDLARAVQLLDEIRVLGGNTSVHESSMARGPDVKRPRDAPTPGAMATERYLGRRPIITRASSV